MSSEANKLTAKERFRQAFERLKTDKPMVLKPGTPVSQNNVAKEAGCDPSALRKSRFPALIREIQAYVEFHRDDRPSQRQVQTKQRKARQEQRHRFDDVVAERDSAQSQLASANRRIVELTEELKLARMQLDQLRPPLGTLKR